MQKNPTAFCISLVYHKVFDALEAAAFQSTEYLHRVYDYSGTNYPFDRCVIEESLNRLTQTEKDVLYLYIWDRKSILAIAEKYGCSDLQIEQILSKVHRKLGRYIWSAVRR